MTIQELVQLYAMAPQVGALKEKIEEKSVKMIFLEGLVASSAPMLFASLSSLTANRLPLTANCQLFILSDEEEAGYFYHDLKQMLGMEKVLFFPSSYRRSIKYAQRDPANEILRTEVLTKLSTVNSQRTTDSFKLSTLNYQLYIVTYPSALAEQVISQEQLNERTLVLEQGQTVSVEEVTKTLHGYGFQEVDYVYEPGQFALRGSILDVYSFSSEYPFRIDFFGDDIDSIRTFEVEDQLSRDRQSQISIVPELSKDEGRRSKVNCQLSIVNYLPEGTLIVAKSLQYVHDAMDNISQENQEVPLIDGRQFMEAIASYKKIEFGHRPMEKPDATLTFHTTQQPLFHKNFDLLRESFADFQSKGYHLYLLADSRKQLQRLEEILSENSEYSEHSSLNSKLLTLNFIDSALHAGFVDHDLQLCVFTDHEIGTDPEGDTSV